VRRRSAAGSRSGARGARFGVPLFVVYATTETMLVGLSEPRSEGLLLLEDDLSIEVEQDRLLVTSLRNRLMPLIRYVLSDSVVLSSREDFPQYRGYRRIETLAGRREDNLELVNEQASRTSFIRCSSSSSTFPGIDRFQVHRTSLTSLVFRVKPRGNQTLAELNRLLRDIRRGGRRSWRRNTCGTCDATWC